ncbi:PH domain-containing protein [Candidatus Saccharibacteria bacterium]|nr:PH domain-containing protein [Candidatus Saccharibacteria bacterium]
MAELSFDGQREGEKVKFVFRRHFITARKGLGFLIFMTIVGLAPMFLWQHATWTFWTFLIFVTIGLLGLGYAYLLWYFSVYIVTNERIRQISQRGLFKKTVVDLGLDKIQSISYGVTSFTGGIFGYGTILIQTAAGDLTISMVAHPNKIYNKLQNIAKKVKDEENI